ncbi:glycosyltransferase family 4 protein [Xylanibacter oryzae]|uniref:glycosyltransferase family 4 protein n=1 Tax=Xylanibacter oryzae TaxID=185293 RepID=UPI0004BB7F2B|nr:glycosyltransferase family 4 protein [Xylanibacter oryzae]
MGKKIVYVVGGLLSPNGMSQVLSQKINYLAEYTDYELYMILTEKAEMPWYYKISSKVKYVNFNINFDELDTMPLLKKIWNYRKKQKKYKGMFTDYLMSIRPDITVSTCRREINFINDIKDGSKKVGEIHFNKSIYRKAKFSFLPPFINKLISHFWIKSFIIQVNKLDKFIVLSDEDSKQWKGLNNINVINNPIKQIPKEYSSCKNKRAIAVGRYTWQKGFDLLIDAWKIVEKKHSDWFLDIYGGGQNDYFVDYAKINGVENIKFNNATEDIYSKYKESSLFIMSSRYEGFGLVLAEAMSCGLPVISFDCPCGPKDIIEDGVNGLLTKEGNIKILAEKICYLIENEDKRIEMGSKAKVSALRFKEGSIMPIWIKLFNDLTL